MIVLVVNCGSSSLKYQLINMDNEEVMAKGLVEKIGLPDSQLTHKWNGQKKEIKQSIPDHQVAVKLVLDILTDAECGVIKSMDAIELSATASSMAAKNSLLPRSLRMKS